MTTHGSSPTIQASSPGCHDRKVSGAVFHQLAVIHHDDHSPGNEAPEVGGLAARGSGNGLDVIGPLPAGQERGAPDWAGVDVDELEVAGAAFKGSGLLGRVEALANSPDMATSSAEVVEPEQQRTLA